ncbi:rhodanese-like domain-containing protein [Conchiformibius steedae]|uniref:Rhodanese-like domain-containing protein n=1 Tax=Conchiformibius steedae TaxID=153493 RepID=A0A3P1ZZZ3_9NEIS|nr:rhodanese-like domain-containing protein [Conchiformibius steedae]RRD88684.1 rhodanese-like domain-containing protein [Conchiformibius steedae]
MKRFLCLTFTLFAAACGNAAQTQTPASAPEAASVVAPKQVLLIDVRSPEEFAAGHLDGAINIPHEQIAEQIARFTQDKNAEIQLYCRSGRRSGVALETLQGMGYKNLSNLGAYDDLKKK